MFCAGSYGYSEFRKRGAIFDQDTLSFFFPTATISELRLLLQDGWKPEDYDLTELDQMVYCGDYEQKVLILLDTGLEATVERLTAAIRRNCRLSFIKTLVSRGIPLTSEIFPSLLTSKLAPDTFEKALEFFESIGVEPELDLLSDAILDQTVPVERCRQLRLRFNSLHIPSDMAHTLIKNSFKKPEMNFLLDRLTFLTEVLPLDTALPQDLYLEAISAKASTPDLNDDLPDRTERSLYDFLLKAGCPLPTDALPLWHRLISRFLRRNSLSRFLLPSLNTFADWLEDNGLPFPDPAGLFRFICSIDQKLPGPTPTPIRRQTSGPPSAPTPADSEKKDVSPMALALYEGLLGPRGMNEPLSQAQSRVKQEEANEKIRVDLKDFKH